MTSTLKVKSLSANLEKKGFRVEQGDHKKYCFYTDGKKTAIRTRV